MGRDRAVVDDAPTHRLLALHHLEGFLRAEERTGEIDVDDSRPLLVGQLLQQRPGGSDAGIVEQNIEPPEGVSGRREQAPD